jgi:hypothetical protein
LEEGLGSLASRTISINASDLATASAELYIRVDNRNAMDRFTNRVKSLFNQNGPGRTHIYVDSEGKNLGYPGGKLGLVQVGVGDDIYIIDVIKYREALPGLKKILEDNRLIKVMWDGRNDFSELWHGHRIHLRNVIDLQLVRIYDCQGQWIHRRGFLRLEGMENAFASVRKRLLPDGSEDVTLKRVRSGQ